MAPRGRRRQYCCNKCSKNFLSGRALGGHMACHWRTEKKAKSTSNPPTVVVDLHVSLLSPCDDKRLLPSSEMQWQMCPKVFSTCKSMRGHMRLQNKSKEEITGLMEALANADGDRSVMVFSSVKRKRSLRSKREIPAFSLEEIDAADALLLLSDHSDKTLDYDDCYVGDNEGLFLPEHYIKTLDYEDCYVGDKEGLFLSEHSDKTSQYEDCHLGDKEGLLLSEHSDKTSNCNVGDKKYCNLASDAPKEVKMNSFDHWLVRSVGLNKPETDKNSAYEDCYGRCDKENSLVPNVSTKKVELNAFDHGLDRDAELREQRTDNSCKEINFHDVSAATKTKNHQCKTCGKLFRSGQALGGHMACHYVRKCNRRREVAGCPSSVMKEQDQKLGLGLGLQLQVT